MFKKIVVVLVALIFIFGCAETKKTVKKQDTFKDVRDYSTEKYTQPKTKVAVVTFENATRFGKRRLGKNITNILLTELKKSDRFIVLERDEVDKILDQVKLSQSGLTQGTLNKVKLLDASYIISGAVTKYAVNTTGQKGLFTKSKTQHAEVSVDIRMIDVRTGEIVMADTGEGVAEREYKQTMGWGSSGGYDESLEVDAFRSSVIKMMENIIKTVESKPWYCDVVKISGSKLYLNAGQKSNVKRGDTFDLYKLGEKIKDLNGRVIGRERQKVGQVKVIDFMGEDASIARYIGNRNLELPLLVRKELK